MSTSAILTALSSTARQEVLDRLKAFEENWYPQSLAISYAGLPPNGNPLRLPLLLGFVQVDLNKRWQQGQPVEIERYLKPFPELAQQVEVIADLLLSEQAARQESGQPKPIEELAKRFHEIELELLQRCEARTRSARESSGSVVSMDESMIDIAPRTTVSLPKQFGRYEIQGELGQGAMGSVFWAQDKLLDRPVALKVANLPEEKNEKHRQRFLQEARAAAKLSHPNLCPIFDVGELNGILYLTMAYLEGKTLRQILETKKTFTPRQTALLVRKLALGLQEAHAQGVIHRDLKPSNVMITTKGEPVIMDFGLARHLYQQGERITQQGVLLGTPTYMAPEQVRGDLDLIGPPTDVYSLGIVLYELLTGEAPFEGPTTAILARILTEVPVPPDAKRPDLPRGLVAICKQAIAQDPKDRFQSMQDLAQALMKWLQEEKTGSPPPAMPPPPPPPIPEPEPVWISGTAPPPPNALLPSAPPEPERTAPTTGKAPAQTDATEVRDTRAQKKPTSSRGRGEVGLLSDGLGKTSGDPKRALKKKIPWTSFIILGLGTVLMIGLIVGAVLMRDDSPPDKSKEEDKAPQTNNRFIPEGWIEHKPFREGFRIALPGEPRKTQGTLIINRVRFFNPIWTYQKGKIRYYVSHFAYHIGVELDKEQMLKWVEHWKGEHLKQEQNGKVISTTEIKIGRYPGWVIQISAANGKSRTQLRLYFVKRHLYTVKATYPTDTEDLKEVENFFKSFELIEDKLGG